LSIAWFKLRIFDLNLIVAAAVPFGLHGSAIIRLHNSSHNSTEREKSAIARHTYHARERIFAVS
jgi:hypothetical protein